MTLLIRSTRLILAAVAVGGSLATRAVAHDTGPDPSHLEASRRSPPAVPLPRIVETKGPLRTIPRLAPGAVRSTGQGYWKFVAVTNGLLPVPPEAQPFLKGAHGTLLVDADRDIVYWGLERVGWVTFQERLSRSEIVKGDPLLARGNLHGADLLRRRGQLPLVAAADNVQGLVYLSDTTFQHVTRLESPPGEPYQKAGEFHPTDVAFTRTGEMYVTDGYGRAFFMSASTDPLRYGGELLGGKGVSQTPHGITYRAGDQSLFLSARPEAQVKQWSLKQQAWLAAYGLPAGSTVCDLDLWGDYALAPCLDGPNNSPGPVYILNLKKKAIVSVLRPKEDLGFSESQHIHDAAWYLSGRGRERELHVLFTYWNPGGIGGMKLVNQPD
jgi:hypothetical protein